jgi:poly(A) polymerase
MLEEFKRADAIVNQIHTGRKSWSDLFERHTFFTKDHKYYLSVIAASRTKEAHDMFSGLVESKVRLLVKGIEEGDAGVELARPYIKAIERVHRCHTEDEIDRIIQGNTDYQVKGEAAANGSPNGKTDGDASKEHHTIYTSTVYIGLTLPEGKTSSATAADRAVNCGAGGTKSLDISYPVSEFKRYITSSDIYDAETMSVRVVHTRRYASPWSVSSLGIANFP